MLRVAREGTPEMVQRRFKWPTLLSDVQCFVRHLGTSDRQLSARYLARYQKAACHQHCRFRGVSLLQYVAKFKIRSRWSRDETGYLR